MDALPAPEAAPQPRGGKLATNIVHFARTLRTAGLRVGPGQVLRAIEAVEVRIDDPFPVPDPDHDPPALEETQADAAEELRDAVDAGEFAPWLLDGVTGSGKTEVYFEAIAEAIRKGRQALVLLPEIALTEPFLKRFAARFCGTSAHFLSLPGSLPK